MSILSSLFHNEIHDKPNDTHNTPKGPLPNDKAPNNSTLTEYAQKHISSIQKNDVKPALYYNEDCSKRTAHGIEQDAHTVASHLEQREETPRG